MFTTKKATRSLLFLIALSTTAFRSDSILLATSDDFATVYVYRTGQLFGATLNYAVFANDEKICKLSNGKYIEHHVKPGHVVYTAKRGGVELFKKETEVVLDVEANKKYFIQCDVKTSITRTRMEMSEVTENTAKRDMAKLTVDNCQEGMNAK